MGEFIYRETVTQNWMSLVYLLNFLLFTFLYYLDPVRLKSILKIYATDFYISKYQTEKNTKFLTLFNGICFVIIANTLCLFAASVSRYYKQLIVYAFEYVYLFLGLFIFLFIRYFLIQFLLKQLNIFKKVKLLFFKSFTHHFQFALVLFFFLFIGFYSLPNPYLFFIFFFFLFVLWSYFQIRILFPLFQSNPRVIFYLILYLCTLKIIPWYWFYFLVIESRL